MGGQDLVADDTLLSAAAAVLARHGYAGLTLERLAAEAGVSRMTLHRRQITLPGVVAGLAAQAVQQVQAVVLPALTGEGTAADRTDAVLRAVLSVADSHLPLLTGLYADEGGIFHAAAGEDGSVPTHDVFVAPLARLLRDGALDGSLRQVDDPVEVATALFNTVGWGYVHLRHAQRWPASRAAEGVLRLVLDGLLPHDARP